MSLALLVVIVVVGIAAIVLAVHLTGGTRLATLEGEDAARRRFAEDFPNATPRRVVLTERANAAFLDLDGVRTGIVQAFGDRFLTRIVSPADIRAVSREETRLTIEFHDFTWRRAEFAFSSRTDALRIAARLSPANQNRKRKIA